MNLKHFALFVLCTLFVIQVHAASFPDTVNSQFEAEIATLKASGAVSGYPEDGTFRPNKWINRAEFVKILLEYNQDIQGTGSSMCFTDFNSGGFETSEWFYAYACEAKALGYIQGYPDGSFGGEKNINLAEALKIVINAKHVSLPQYIEQPEHWYDPYFIVADELSVFHKINSNPAHLVTRAEMAHIIVTINRNVNAKVQPEDFSYTACGCGCCGGYPHEDQKLMCVSKEEFSRVVAQDQDMAKSPDCKFMGCSMGNRYSICD